MKGWNICDQDLLIRQYESERDSCSQDIFPSLSCYQSKLYGKGSPKLSAKGSEKTSLKNHRKNHRQQDSIISNPRVLTFSTVQIKRTSSISNTILLKPQQNCDMHKIQYTNIQVPKVTYRPSDVYYINPPPIRLILLPINKVNVKINYINQNKINSQVTNLPNQQITHITPQYTQMEKSLKRTNTVPTTLGFSHTFQHDHEQSYQDSNQFNYSKSVDRKHFNRPLKCQKKLHQITCVKVESIGDQSQDMDQISIVVSPFEDETPFGKGNFLPESWRNYINPKAPSSPDTAQEQQQYL